MIPVDLWHGEDHVASLLLPGAPQIGHRVILMDMDIRLGSADDETVDWTVTAAIWGCRRSPPCSPRRLGEDSLRALDLQVVPTKEVAS